jgi:hypothetical protein
VVLRPAVGARRPAAKLTPSRRPVPVRWLPPSPPLERFALQMLESSA